MKGSSVLAFLLGLFLTISLHASSMTPDEAKTLTTLLDTVVQGGDATTGQEEPAVVAEAVPETEMRVAKKSKSKKYNFSFLGNGLLGVYGLGVATRLYELGALKRNSNMYGTSSGSQVVGGLCSGASTDEMYSSTKALVQQCAADLFQCLGSIDAKVAANLEQVIPSPKGKTYPQCKNTYVAVTLSSGNCNLTSNPIDYGSLNKPEFLTGFNTKEDLISVLRGSSYIPGFSSNICYRTVRGKKVIDGGFSANSFCLSKECVKVYAFPPTLERPVDIYPGVRPGTLIDWPFQNANDWQSASFLAYLVAPRFDAIYQFAKADADYWFAQQQQN